MRRIFIISAKDYFDYIEIIVESQLNLLHIITFILFFVCSFGDGVSYPTRCSDDADVEDGMMESLLGGDSSRQDFEFVNETDNFLANTQ